MSFWAELKRRKVFKAGAAYAVVAWLLIQVTATLLPAFGAPAWTVPAFAAMVIMGFPVALVLAWAYEITPDGVRVTTGESSTHPVSSQAFSYAIVGLLVVGAVYFLVSRPSAEQDLGMAVMEPLVLARSGPGNGALSRRFFINLEHTIPLGESRLDASVALSPDGKRLVYAVQRENALPQLYLQDLDQLEARAVPGTADAENPFFSPDGEWIAFGTTGANGSATLSKISIRGGTAQALVGSIRAGTGGFWAADGSIYYTSDEADGLRLRRVPAAGGVSDTLTLTPANTELAHTWPHLLPNEDALLFTNRPYGGNASDGRIDLLTISSGHVETVIQSGYNARYVPTGHIVFVRSGTLWAVPFDLASLETVGPEVPVIQDVQTAGVRGEAVYSFSNDGLLVYRQGGDTQAAGAPKTLVRIDRDGGQQDLELARDYRVAAVSPDGQRVAVEASEAGNEDIWIYDLERNTLSRLTFDPSDDYMPVWTPDGERVVYGSDRDGGLWWRAADGTGQEELLVSNDNNGRLRALSFSPDGRQLVYQAGNPADLFVVALDGEAAPRTLLQTSYTETMASISPDGRWIAYVSNEASELLQVYVRPYPDVDGGKWQISSEGGIWPKWGRTLYFLSIASGVSVWTAAVQTEPGFQFERPRRLLSGPYSEGGLYQLSFDVFPDGQGFLLARDDTAISTDEALGLTQLVVVDNWFDELVRLAPPGEGRQLAAIVNEN